MYLNVVNKVQHNYQKPILNINNSDKDAVLCFNNVSRTILILNLLMFSLKMNPSHQSYGDIATNMLNWYLTCRSNREIET